MGYQRRRNGAWTRHSTCEVDQWLCCDGLRVVNAQTAWVLHLEWCFSWRRSSHCYDWCWHGLGRMLSGKGRRYLRMLRDRGGSLRLRANLGSGSGNIRPFAQESNRFINVHILMHIRTCWPCLCRYCSMAPTSACLSNASSVALV